MKYHHSQQWRIQTRRLGRGQSNKGAPESLHLYKYPIFCVTIVWYHTKVVIFSRPRKWLFLLVNFSFLPPKEPIWQPCYKDVIERDMRGFHISLQSWEALAADRNRWRASLTYGYSLSATSCT